MQQLDAYIACLTERVWPTLRLSSVRRTVSLLIGGYIDAMLDHGTINITDALTILDKLNAFSNYQGR